jgi:HK97 family phage prohead protease
MDSSRNIYKEVIARGAFTESLKNNPDVMAFKEHDTKMILGRVSAGTLSLRDEEDGLYVEIVVPNTSYGNDLLESVNRGDIKGFSFGFKPKKSKTYRRGDEKIVERVEIDLVEVSPTARPAYNESEMNLRTDDDVWTEERADEQLSQEEKQPTEENKNTIDAYKQKLRFTEFVMNNTNVDHK